MHGTPTPRSAQLLDTNALRSRPRGPPAARTA